MRIWRSTIKKLVVAAFLGVLSTVGIAWLGVVFDTPMAAASTRGQCETDEFITTFNVRRSIFLTEVYWTGYSQHGFVRPSDKGNSRLEALPSWSSAWHPAKSDLKIHDSGDANQTWEIASGWPMRSMLSVLHDHPTWMSGGGIPYVTLSGIPLSAMRVGNAFQGRALPVRVLPIGFAIDFVTHASFWWLALFGFSIARLALRRRRGACPACGYGLRGALGAGCSECGWNRGAERV